MKLVIAGGAGSLGRRVARHFADRGDGPATSSSPAGTMPDRGSRSPRRANSSGSGPDEIVILTRSQRPDISHRQMIWDGRTVGSWARELDGSVLLNLAGELVDRRPTASNVRTLERSRVEPTAALVEAAATSGPPALWLQMSTLAIYGDSGEEVIDESHPPASGPPQMSGVATAWEKAVEGAAAGRLVVLRTGIVLDRDTPALDRLTRLTRLGLGGRIGNGRQWISWIHVDDFLRTLELVIDDASMKGVVHVASPNPIRNRDMMATLRRTLHRPWSPPTPTPLVRLGARLMRTDPALALTGRRCVPQRLIAAGFEFTHPTFEEAVANLVGRGQLQS